MMTRTIQTTGRRKKRVRSMLYSSAARPVPPKRETAAWRGRRPVATAVALIPQRDYSTVHRDIPGCVTASVTRPAIRGKKGESDLAVQRGLEHTDVRQLPVALPVVQPVPDDELVGQVEPDILHRYLHLDRVRLAQQCHHLDTRGRPALQVFHQPGQGEPGVDDVLDHDHMPAGDVPVQVLEDAHHAGRGGPLSVRGHRHELQLDRAALAPHRAGEVGHEHDRALEHAHQQHRLDRAVVSGDLLGEVLGFLPDLLLGNDHAVYVRVIPGPVRHGTRVPYPGPPFGSGAEGWDASARGQPPAVVAGPPVGVVTAVRAPVQHASYDQREEEERYQDLHDGATFPGVEVRIASRVWSLQVKHRAVVDENSVAGLPHYRDFLPYL